MDYTAFDQTPFGVAIWEVSTEVTLKYANKYADLMGGSPITGLVGETIESFSGVLVTDPTTSIEEVLRKTLTTKKALTLRNMSFDAEGGSRKYNIHLSCLSENTVLLTYSTAPQQHSIQRVVEIEQKLLMLRNLPGNAVYTELDGTVLVENRFDEGVDKVHSFIGQDIFTTFTSESEPVLREAARRVIDGEELVEFVCPGLPPGHYYSSQVKLVKLPGNGVVLLWTSWDVTAQMVEEEKLRLANEDLEQFAYIVSHDLQEPIRTIAAYIDILLDDYPKLFAEGEPQEFMTFIRDSALRQQDLIRDVLTYSRTSDMVFETCNLVDCFLQVEASLTSLIHRHNAIIEWEGPREFMVVGSPTYLEMALQNLISNAIKYTPAGRIPVVRLSVDEENHFWRVHITDNGLGIEPAYADQVFRMFKRLHQQTIETEGTGIGLPVCRRIARKHGGNCWFESVPGKGSVFHFSIRKPLNLDAG